MSASCDSVRYIKASWAGGLSKKTIGQKDKRHENTEEHIRRGNIKCVCLSDRSIINKKNELNIMVDDIKPI